MSYFHVHLCLLVFFRLEAVVDLRQCAVSVAGQTVSCSVAVFPHGLLVFLHSARTTFHTKPFILVMQTLSAIICTLKEEGVFKVDPCKKNLFSFFSILNVCWNYTQIPDHCFNNLTLLKTFHLLSCNLQHTVVGKRFHLQTSLDHKHSITTPSMTFLLHFLVLVMLFVF